MCFVPGPTTLGAGAKVLGPRCWGQNSARIQNKEVYATFYLLVFAGNLEIFLEEKHDNGQTILHVGVSLLLNIGMDILHGKCTFHYIFRADPPLPPHTHTFCTHR